MAPANLPGLIADLSIMYDRLRQAVDLRSESLFIMELANLLDGLRARMTHEADPRDSFSVASVLLSATGGQWVDRQLAEEHFIRIWHETHANRTLFPDEVQYLLRIGAEW